MVKLILAIAAAAACAGIVVLAPELGPKSAMAATQLDESGASTQRFVVTKENQQSDGAACNTGHITNKAVFATRVCRMELSEWFAS